MTIKLTTLMCEEVVVNEGDPIDTDRLVARRTESQTGGSGGIGMAGLGSTANTVDGGCHDKRCTIGTIVGVEWKNREAWVGAHQRFIHRAEPRKCWRVSCASVRRLHHRLRSLLCGDRWMKSGSTRPRTWLRNNARANAILSAATVQYLNG